MAPEKISKIYQPSVKSHFHLISHHFCRCRPCSPLMRRKWKWGTRWLRIWRQHFGLSQWGEWICPSNQTMAFSSTAEELCIAQVLLWATCKTSLIHNMLQNSLSKRSVSCHGRISLEKPWLITFSDASNSYYFKIHTCFFSPWQSHQQLLRLTQHHKVTFKDIRQPTNTNCLPLPISSSFQAVHQPVPVV